MSRISFILIFFFVLMLNEFAKSNDVSNPLRPKVRSPYSIGPKGSAGGLLRESRTDMYKVWSCPQNDGLRSAERRNPSLCADNFVRSKPIQCRDVCRFVWAETPQAPSPKSKEIQLLELGIWDLELGTLDSAAQFKKKKRTAALFAFPLPFGIIGIHRIFLGTKPYIPFVYIGTAGGCAGILPLIDFIAILRANPETFKRFENNPKVFIWGR